MLTPFGFYEYHQYVKQLSPNSGKDTNYDSEQDIMYPIINVASSDIGRIHAKKKENFKLKNQLCRNFVRQGYCRYGDKCQFAHGIEELRKNDNQNSKYKTKKCLTYHKDGFCMYGVRCNFKHNDQVYQPPKLNVSSLQMLEQYPELIMTKTKRLGVFREMERETE